MKNSELELDEYELALKERTKELNNCQEKKQINSCMKCDEFFDCEIRKAYVDGVFNSMNKGGVGGFEF